VTKRPAGHGERDANGADRPVGREESGMALGHGKPVRSQTGQVSHDSLVRADRRVKEILARQEVALQQARRAAERLSGAAPESRSHQDADDGL
jgi:hypothetical protein